MAHYDIFGFSNPISDGEHLNGNIISKLINLFIEAINEQTLLPKAIIVIIDDDIMDELDHYKNGISLAIGRIIEYLAESLHSIINSHKEALPTKAWKFKFPAILWCLIPQHNVYDQFNEFKRKFNKAVDKTAALYREMFTLRLSDWDPRELNYFTEG